MIALVGGAGAAIAWALSTLCSSRSSRLIDPLAVVSWVMLVGLAITGPLALVSGIPSQESSGSWAWLVASGAGNVGGLVLAYAALRVGQVVLVAPLISTEGAIAALIAVAAGESIAEPVALALGVIVVGVCLSGVQGEKPVVREPSGRSRHLEAVMLALLAAFAFGGSLYATARAGAVFPESWVVLSARVIGVVAVGLPLLVARRLRLTRPAAVLVVASGIGEVAGFYSYVAGARHGPAIAAVVSSQFATIAAVAAYLLFGERLARVQVVGIVMVIAGVATLSVLRS